MKKYTFFVMSNNGTSMRQFSVSRNLVISAALVFLGSVCALTYFGQDYSKLRDENVRASVHEKTIARQIDLISGQNKQIENFAVEINALKKNLVELNKFESKIRIIANIEKKDKGGDSLFGIGGSIPGDLQPLETPTSNPENLMREMHQVVGVLDSSSQKQENDFEGLLKYLKDQRNLLASTPAIWPARGYITSKFGYRESPFTGRKELHKGMDIANRSGKPIMATADGVITFAGKKGLLGIAIVIDHGHGIITRYGHLKKTLMKKGTRVKRGDVIALMGNTGRSTGPHVHYEVRLNGIPVNPAKYILN